MAIKHVRIHQVGEDQIPIAPLYIPQGGFDAVMVVLGVVCQADASMAKDILDLTNGNGVISLGCEPIQDGFLHWGHCKVPPIFRAGIMAVASDKRPRDHPPHQIRPHQHGPGCLAHFI